MGTTRSLHNTKRSLFLGFKLRVIVSRTSPIHPERGSGGVVRVTCVLYAVIIVKVDGGFLREFT